MARGMWLGLLLAGQAVIAAPAADFVVAPGGSDKDPGTAAKPFASLNRARLAVRELRAAQPTRSGPVTVQVRGGWYTLTAPLAFEPQDSGTASSPTVYAAAPGETPVLSGGRRLSGWTVKDGRWTLTLPADMPAFSQLFVNSQPRFRPRLPKTGYYTIAGDLEPSAAAQGKGHDRFTFKAGDLKPDWKNLADVEVLSFNEWNMSRLRIAKIDPATNEVAFTGPTCNTSYWAALRRGYRYLVDNVAEALDTPGQWYLDKATRQLTYLPLPGETPRTTVVVAPVIEELIRIKGDAAAGLPVTQVQLAGLTFAHTNWVCPLTGNSFPQAEANLTAAVVAKGAQKWRLTDCTFAHLGTWGVDLGEGCRDNVIERCTVSDIGAGGIKIGTTGIPADEKAWSGWTTVRDCTFSHGGRLHPAAIGVWIAHSPNNVIEQNDIYDFYYTGISVGWSWGYGRSLSHDNLITDNHVWQIGQGVLSDMGGIYTLGLSPGSVIEHNCFHDIDAFSYGGWGIYFDEGTSDIVARNNLVYRTKTGGFHQHYGKNNLFENNIVAYARIGQLQRTRDEQHHQFTLERNIILWDQGPLMHGNWGSPERFALNHNLYWDTSGSDVRFGGMDLAAWQAKGEDKDSLVADPQFVDPEKGDFRLRPGSPAEKVGFKPFPLSGWGRRDAAGAWALKPAAPAYPLPPATPAATSIAVDFEGMPVGAKPDGFQVNEDDTVKEANCRVTDEKPASGQRCLKLTDRPGQKNIWDPHCILDPAFQSGVIEETFDLRLTAGAVLTHEWRDMTQNPYVTGPAIAVGADGTLSAAGAARVKLPLDAWVRIRIVGGLGKQQTGLWTLEVTLPGAKPQIFSDLPCGKSLRALRWVCWTSHANAATAYYLDNIKIAPVKTKP
ncbi:MAG: right-handed parallel beta-helix repeat-containing protein [Armatimonadetes bacterium]|nr:right-handed parallel beta-helix repeat-containing protein [Armatimonadota bacterium]